MSAESSNGPECTNQRDIGLNDHRDNVWFVTVPPPFKFWWYPPEDPDEPSFPYIPGLILNIDRHVPPSPHFAQNLREQEQREPFLPTDYLRSVPRSKVVVDKSPLETEPPVSPETAHLVVTAPIAVGAARGSQIISCIIHSLVDNGGARPFEAVAKIYDPLYYGFQSELGGGPRDIVHWADQDYSKEAAAYEQLLKAGETGLSAPLYYGVLDISSSHHKQRRNLYQISPTDTNGTAQREDNLRYSYPE
ncbi:hypothetical protein F5883DRAFT_638973 [Diaporthe sp. PMI_573]|nr:hypothetical protein F5883DRAFT_638973 [Diaporthaceae sp. PMI_573]